MRATAMNARSSRSHTVVQLVLDQKLTHDKAVTTKRSKVFLVDLAGSERVGKTGNTGDGAREGSIINLSLFTLGQVISALAAGSKNVLPYRQSKLTALLQQSLSGNSKTCMLAAASPADYNRDETRGTLQFASRCKLIKTRASVNIDSGAVLIGSLHAENDALRSELSKLRHGGAGHGLVGADVDDAVRELRAIYDSAPKSASGSALLADFQEMLEQIRGQQSHALVLLKLLLTDGLEDDDDARTFTKIDADGSGTLDWPELESWVREAATDPRVVEQHLVHMLATREQLIREHREHSMAEVHRETLEYNRSLIGSLTRQLEHARAELIVLYRRTGADPGIQSELDQCREQVGCIACAQLRASHTAPADWDGTAVRMARWWWLTRVVLVV